MSSTMIKLAVSAAAAAYTIYKLFFAEDQDAPPPNRSQSYEPPSVPRLERNESQNYPLFYESRQPLTRQRDEQQRQENIKPPKRDHQVPVEARDTASLRARAKQEGDFMSQCYTQSKDAYDRGDHPNAKALSEKGKRHAANVENLNAQASAAIFQENNKDRPAGDVDLHGLHVKEAITYSEKAISDARRRGDSEIRLIVGQGNHSKDGISRLKPAIQDDMQLLGHSVDVDPRNPGVLVVRLGGR